MKTSQHLSYPLGMSKGYKNVYKQQLADQKWELRFFNI